MTQELVQDLPPLITYLMRLSLFKASQSQLQPNLVTLRHFQLFILELVMQRKQHLQQICFLFQQLKLLQLMLQTFVLHLRTLQVLHTVARL